MTNPQPPKHFINPDVYFMTHSPLTGLSKEHYTTYDEARKIVEEDRLNCEKNGIESDLTVAGNVGEGHNKIVGELIEDYRKSRKKVKDPMVVMFEQSKEYMIMAKSELTPGLWREKPYVTYGSLEMVERMVRIERKRRRIKRVLRLRSINWQV
jgi:hypothetical protein